MRFFPTLAAAGLVATATLVPAMAADITGAGATFPYPIYGKWADAYKKETGIGLNYQSIGSGGGIKQIQNKTVTFGASDMPRCSTLRSSRMFPGQSYSRRMSMAPAVMRGGGLPWAAANSATMCSESAAMSSLRSRSGGTKRHTTASRWYRSALKRPAFASLSRSRLVAATIRTSTDLNDSPPTGLISRAGW